MTQTEVTRAVQFLNPTSGEVLTLAAPDADLAAYLDDLKEFNSVLTEHRRMVEGELARRRDQVGKWTWQAGDYDLSMPSPEPAEVWDGPTLREHLLQFVDSGQLAIEAVDAAVETIVDYKPRKAGINALRKLGGEIAATVDALCERMERPRYVKVKRHDR